MTSASGDLGVELGVDLAGLAHELATAGVLVAPSDLRVELLPGGRSNVTMLVRSPTDCWVLRRPPLDATRGAPSLLDREVRVLRALDRTNVPVPTVLASWTDERVIGSPGYMMTFSAGTILEDHLREEAGRPAPELDVDAVITSMVDVLAAIHAVPVAKVGLSEWHRPGNFLTRRLERWTAVWEATTSARPRAEELARTLKASAPPPAGSTLVHGDFRAGNLVLGPSGDAVTSVLDWEMSTVGDPLTDLGFLIAYSEPVEGRISHRGQDLLVTLASGVPLRMADRYAHATGRAVDDVAWYVAEEHWKTAAVLQMIAERNRCGATVGTGFDGIDDSIDAHLESAAAILKG